MSILSIEFTPESLREIVRIAGVPVLLPLEVQKAMRKGASLIIAASRANMHWKRPTGALERSMTQIADTPYEILVGSHLPYARRRHDGFEGSDSQGRVYHDVGQPFLAKALVQEERPVLLLLDEAIGGLF